MTQHVNFVHILNVLFCREEAGLSSPRVVLHGKPEKAQIDLTCQLCS